MASQEDVWPENEDGEYFETQPGLVSPTRPLSKAGEEEEISEGEEKIREEISEGEKKDPEEKQMLEHLEEHLDEFCKEALGGKADDADQKGVVEEQQDPKRRKTMEKGPEPEDHADWITGVSILRKNGAGAWVSPDGKWMNRSRVRPTAARPEWYGDPPRRADFQFGWEPLDP